MAARRRRRPDEVGALADLLGFVDWHAKREGFPPTWREASDHLGLSPYRVADLVRRARARSFLRSRARSARTHRVTSGGRVFARRWRRRR